MSNDTLYPGHDGHDPLPDCDCHPCAIHARNTLRERLAAREDRLWSAIGGREAHWIEHADEDGKRRRDQMTLEGALVFLHGADQRAQQAEQRAERAEALAEQNAKAIAYFRQQVSLTLGDRVRAEWDAAIREGEK